MQPPVTRCQGCHQASLARQVGMVLQDPYLFHGSVVENIRYGKSDASLEEVIEAATAAALSEKGPRPVTSCCLFQFGRKVREWGVNKGWAAAIQDKTVSISKPQIIP